MANRQNPAIYLAKADDITAPEKTSYGKISKSKSGRKLVVKKTTNHRRAKVFAKKKGKAKIFAKGRTKKNYRVAKRDSVERNKG